MNIKHTLSILALTLSFSSLAGNGHMKEKIIERLDLNTEQAEQFEIIMQERKAKMDEINGAAQEQFSNILTDEQFAEWTLIQERKNKRRAQAGMQELDLTDEQKEQVKAVLTESKEQMKSIKESTKEQLSTFLTEEQVAQVAKRLNKRKHRRGSR